MNTNLSIKFADWINSDDCPYVHVKSASGKSSWVNSVKQNVYTFSSDEHKESLISTGIKTDDLFDVFLGVITPVELIELGWIYEDSLPSSITKEQYNEWYKYSKIVRGVRMGERPIICGIEPTEIGAPSNDAVLFETKEKIYISGKITDIEKEAPALFKQAECALREKGYDTVNPITLNHDHDKSWQNFMREDVKAMLDCDSIYMMSNWVNSKGAKIEREIAIYLGLKVIYEEPYDESCFVLPVIKEVISVFGIDHQLGMAGEELGELVQAANKIKRTFTIQQLEDIKKGGKFKSVEDSLVYCGFCSEVADVKIMIDQLEYIFSLEHINLSKERRLERLQNTVNKEKEKRRQQGLIDYKIEEHE